MLVGLFYALGVQSVPSLGQVDVEEEAFRVGEGDVLLLAELHEVGQEPEVVCGRCGLEVYLANRLKGLLAIDHG